METKENKRARRAPTPEWHGMQPWCTLIIKDGGGDWGEGGGQYNTASPWAAKITHANDFFHSYYRTSRNTLIHNCEGPYGCTNMRNKDFPSAVNVNQVDVELVSDGSVALWHGVSSCADIQSDRQRTSSIIHFMNTYFPSEISGIGEGLRCNTSHDMTVFLYLYKYIFIYIYI